jgi:hypothetical protein
MNFHYNHNLDTTFAVGAANTAWSARTATILASFSRSYFDLLFYLTTTTILCAIATKITRAKIFTFFAFTKFLHIIKLRTTYTLI